MAATTGVEGYVRISLLTHEGGIWISKKILLRELAKIPKSPSLATYLYNNKEQLTDMQNAGHITEKQYNLLLPKYWEDPNIDDWDLTLLIKIVQNLFTLKSPASTNLYNILFFRNDNICHVTEKQMYLSEHAFNGLWKHLTKCLRSLALNCDDAVTIFSDMENKYKNRPNIIPLSIDKLREICRNDDDMEKVLADLKIIEQSQQQKADGFVSANTKHDDMNAKQDITHSTLEDFTTMAASTGVEGYVRIFLLTHEGGIWISKKILLRELAKIPKSPSLATYLKTNKEQLTSMQNAGHITEKQYNLLFPRYAEDPNIDDWDLALLIKIVQKLFTLKSPESTDLNNILIFQQENMCHVTEKQMNLSEHAFNGLWERLTSCIRRLALNCDDAVTIFSDMENYYKNWTNNIQLSIDKLREICRNHDDMEKVLARIENRIEQSQQQIADELVSAQTKLDAIMATTDITHSRLEELVALLKLRGPNDVQTPIEFPTTVRITGNDKEVVELAMDTLTKFLESSIKKAGVEIDDDSLTRAINYFLDDIKKADALAVSVKSGSIILNIKCPTLQSLENILSLFMEHNRWRLHGLEKALSERFQVQLEVDLVLTGKTVEMLYTWIDGFLNETSNLLVDIPCTRTLSMGIQCRSAEAVAKVVNYLYSEESTNRLKKLSEALSEVVQDEVMVDVQVDTKGFEEALKSWYETELLKQEQARHDAEAWTSHIKCNPENVQTKNMLDRFEDELYINWLKRSLALIYTKKALESFTDREVCALHNQLRPPGSSTGAPSTCCACSKTQLKNQWFKGTFKCYGNVCDKWVQGILQHHVFLRQVEWDNVDISQLPLVPWECMKLYLPFGYQRQSNVQEFDLAALLTLYLNCRHFHTFFNSMIICKQVKKIRNRVMHSGQMKVDTTQLLEDVTTIKALLQDTQHLINDPDCQEGVRKIDKLIAGKLELSITKKLELRVLNSSMRELGDKVVQMQNKYEDISNKLHTMSGDVKALKEETIGNKAQGAELQMVKQDIIEMKNSVDVFSSFMTAHSIQGVDTTSLLQCESKLTSLSQNVEQTLKQHEQKLLEHDQTLHHKGQKVQEHDQTLHQQEQKVQEHAQTLHQQEQKVQEHDQTLHQQEQKVQEYDQTLHKQENIVQEHDQTPYQRWQKYEQRSQQQGQPVQDPENTCFVCSPEDEESFYDGVSSVQVFATKVSRSRPDTTSTSAKSSRTRPDTTLL